VQHQEKSLNGPSQIRGAHCFGEGFRCNHCNTSIHYCDIHYLLLIVFKEATIIFLFVRQLDIGQLPTNQFDGCPIMCQIKQLLSF